MKKKIAILTSVLVIFALLLVCLQALLVPKYMDKSKEGNLIGEYYDNAGNNDVIFIGDCEVYENFSPITLWEEYGITSYIRGSAQQLICLNYVVDVTKPVGERVIIGSLADGTPFSTEAEYNVAMTSYRASGGGGLMREGAGIDTDRIDERVVEYYPEIRELIYDYLVDNVIGVNTYNPIAKSQRVKKF